MLIFSIFQQMFPYPIDLQLYVLCFLKNTQMSILLP